MRLETRVLATFGVLLVVLVAGSLFLVRRHMTERAESTAREALSTSRRVFEELLTIRADALVAEASLVAQLPVVRAAAGRWEPGELSATLREIQRLVGSEVVIVTDRMGVILARSDRRWTPGEVFQDATSVARALRGHRAVSIWVQGNRLYHMVSVPVRVPAGLAGTLSIGFAMDADLARQLARVSGHQVAFLVGGRVVASSGSLSRPDRIEIERLARELGNERVRFGDVSLGGERPGIVVGALYGSGVRVGAFAIFRSLASEAAELRNLEERLTIGALVALAAVLVLGLLLARAMVRPLTTLTAAAGELSRGNYEAPLPAPTGSAEVAELTLSFERMRRALRARLEELHMLAAELESRVHSRTRELEEALSENRRLLAELRKHGDELERKVEKRSRELQEAQRLLVRQDRMAAIGRLAAGIAHEINNPLGVLSGFTEGLQDRARAPGLAGVPAFAEFPEHLRLIGAEIERLQTIVQKFLGFARSRGPRVSLMDVNDVAREVAQLLSNHATRERKNLIADIAVEPLWIDADPEQIKQVLLNLALNGIDAIDPGGEVRVETGADDGTVRIMVGDDGPGIPPEVRDRLFEPFVTTKPPEKGTGLGLSLCHDLVQENGGTIELRSPPSGTGSEFVIRFPVATKEKVSVHG